MSRNHGSDDAETPLQPTAGGPALTGLVLGGGAALGAAHVGVLQVLEEAGLSFELVVGSSAGAVIGSAYASGLTVDRLTDEVLDARFGSFAAWRPSGRWGLFDTAVMERSVEKVVGPVTIAELPRRFGAMAFDLRTRRPVLITSGPLATAVRASSAVPGLFPPVAVGDQLLVDGLLADNVPIGAAQSMGAHRVLAVSLESRSPDRVLASVSRWTRESVLGALDPVTIPALVIRPRTESFARWNHSDVPELIAAGRQAAEEALDDILVFLQPADDQSPAVKSPAVESPAVEPGGDAVPRQLTRTPEEVEHGQVLARQIRAARSGKLRASSR
jgi:NTE family protein